MKKLTSLSLGVCAIAFLGLNYSAKSTRQGKNSLLSSNIHALQAVADDGTYNCDQTNPNCCSYPGMNSNGVLSYATGTLTNE
jgi:hypothetical protein